MKDLVDFHSHIIFGVDDGAKDEEMTLEMLKIAEDCGTTDIVATPHFIRGRFQVPREEINKRLEEIKALAREKGLKIKIHPGQEVHYSKNILEYFEEWEIGTIGNTRYMLCELPLKEFNIEEVLDGFYELKLKGIKIILAHPERYETFIKEPRLINEFLEEGFLFQLNLGSLTGQYGRGTKKTAELFVKHKIYSAMGSDGHRAEGRNTNITEGLEALKVINREYIGEINATARLILKDEEVTFQGKRIQKKNLIEKLLGR